MKPLLAVAVALAGFALLARMPAAVVALDQQIADTLRSDAPQALLNAAFVVTRLGNFETLLAIGLLVAAGLAVKQRWSDLAVWLAVTIGNGMLNRTLKLAFARVRPLHDHGLVIEPAYSFPSGHASGSLAVYGLLALLAMPHLAPARRRPLLLGTAVLVLLIGASRVILQVHYLSDVVAGSASAATLLLTCLAIRERMRQRPVS